MRAEFSEREFEFCFNSEFIRRQPTGCLATALIPSQRREGKLGYDVELRVSNREFTRSAFVQHKVPHLLSRWGRSTSQLLNLHGGPYYRFEIYSSKKSQQHELLWLLARSGQRVYYYAPKATASEELQRLVASNTVVDQCVRVDLRGLPHSVTVSVTMWRTTTATCSRSIRLIRHILNQGEPGMSYSSLIMAIP